MQQLHERLKRELLSNLIAYLLLKCVTIHGGRSYGYQMKLLIEDLLSEKISEGTLYTLLSKLASENKYGYFDSYLEETNSKRKRRYYVLTDWGEEELKKWIKEWNEVKNTIDQVIKKVNNIGGN